MNTKCEYANDGQRITQPGKFEGEPVFAPYFWNMALEGLADSDDSKVFTFRFNKNVMPGQVEAELKAWPTLKEWLGGKRTLRMCEDDQGFVRCFH